MKKTFLTKIKQIFDFFQQKPIISCIITTLIVNFIIESLSRHSVLEALHHLFTRPLVFLYNSAIIFFTLSIAFLFKRRNFIVILLSVLWMTLGVVNCILLFFRTTPLSLIDFLIIQNALGILPVYMGFFEVLLLALWIGLVITALVLVWKKLPNIRMSFKKSVPLIAASTVIVSVSSMISVAIASRNDSFAVLTKAYDNWGFVYCFARGLIDSGIEKPDEYSVEDVNSALSLIDYPEKEEMVHPNIVVLQLESFFDVNYLKNYTFSENPTPTFTWVKDNCPGGLLTVPSIGGGTANTEFEFLTGISLDIFGIGEYPYQTVLKETPCESMARTLNDKGYVSTAIHNHTAIFYKRNQAYASLGFDKFVPVEFMNTEKNELGWAKDTVLLGEISEAMQSTPEKDFIFTVTVQGHGKYPEEDEFQYDKIITADGFDLTESSQVAFKYGLEYYVNQLRQTDAFVKDLIEYFKSYPEPVALVLYGDHLPAFNITDDDLNGCGIYQTEYCIWTNYTELEKTRKDIQSYQLNAVLFEKLGLNAGMLPRVTQVLEYDENYKEVLSLLAYDMLYGKNYALGESLKRSDMQFGIKPLTITDVMPGKETALVYGGKFTPYSTVFVDGERIETVFVDPNTLKINIDDLKSEGCEMVVAQLNYHSDNLGESEPFTVNPF